MMRIAGHRRIQMNRDSPAGVSGKARRSRRRRFNRFLMMMIEASAQKSWKKKASWHYVRHHPSISPSISPARSSRAHKSYSQATTRDSYAFMDLYFFSLFAFHRLFVPMNDENVFFSLLLWLVNGSVREVLMWQSGRWGDFNELQLGWSSFQGIIIVLTAQCGVKCSEKLR